MAKGQLELRPCGRGWHSVVIAGTKAAVLMAMPLKKSEALKTLNWLESLTDWSRPHHELAADAELMRTVISKRSEIYRAYYEKGNPA